MNYKLILDLAIVYALVIGVYLFGYFTPSLISYTQSYSSSLDSEELPSCDSEDVVKCAYYLRDWVREFYNYTVRTDVSRTLEDIKYNGGDCYDYAHLYERAAKEKGFNARVESLFTDNLGHAYAVMWDKNLSAYCKLDNLKVDCSRLRRLNSTLEVIQ